MSTDLIPIEAIQHRILVLRASTVLLDNGFHFVSFVVNPIVSVAHALQRGLWAESFPIVRDCMKLCHPFPLCLSALVREPHPPVSCALDNLQIM